MSDVERLEAELARAKLIDEYQELRASVEDGSRTDEQYARYRELNDQIAAMNADISERFAPVPPEPGDAVATPAVVSAKAGG